MEPDGSLLCSQDLLLFIALPLTDKQDNTVPLCVHHFHMKGRNSVLQ